MTRAAQEVLKAFEALSPPEQQELAAEILRRTAPEGDLPDAGLDKLAADLFRRYDAEETARGGP
jgi:hypothetical protein